VVEKVEHLFHVVRARVYPDPDAIAGGKIVGEQVEDELVDAELSLVALDDEVGALPRPVQLVDAVDEEGQVVGPHHRRTHRERDQSLTSKKGKRKDRKN
jgi:hypothetical protein